MKILIGVDGSEYSDAALDEVSQRTWPKELEILVVNAYEMLVAPTIEVWAMPPDYYDQLDRAVRTQSNAIIGAAVEKLKSGLGIFGPLEARPPLVVDPYAVLPFAFSFQSFKAIAGQSSQIHHSFKTVELQPRSPFNTEERFNSLSPREVSRALVPVAEDHNSPISHSYALRQA